MRCILCDRCKSIVEDSRKIRVVTYARPLKPGPVRADDHTSVDHIWTKELCQSCAEALEDFMNSTTSDVPGIEDDGVEDSGDGGDSWTDEVMSE